MPRSVLEWCEKSHIRQLLSALVYRLREWLEFDIGKQRLLCAQRMLSARVWTCYLNAYREVLVACLRLREVARDSSSERLAYRRNPRSLRRD